MLMSLFGEHRLQFRQRPQRTVFSFAPKLLPSAAFLLQGCGGEILAKGLLKKQLVEGKAFRLA